MINTAIILCIGIGLWQLAIGAQSWPAWAVLLVFLVVCKLTGAGKSRRKTKRYGRYGGHW